MISFELLRIIRNPKCKYGLLIALGTFAFHSQMQQFLTSQYSSISFTMLVVFLFLLFGFCFGFSVLSCRADARLVRLGRCFS